MRPLYIFDIDGTLANIEHRVFKLKKTDCPNKWKEFYDLCDGDKPIIPVIETLNRFLATGVEVWFFTGRTESVRNKTERWLQAYIYDCGKLNITMRSDGDYTPDDTLKQSWYDSMLREDQDRLVAVFDDRQKVVDMWRSNGVTCFQVAKGDF